MVTINDCVKYINNTVKLYYFVFITILFIVMAELISQATRVIYYLGGSQCVKALQFKIINFSI